jgi:hypothetical protein
MSLKYLDISYYGKIKMPQVREGTWLRNGLTVNFKKV